MRTLERMARFPHRVNRFSCEPVPRADIERMAEMSTYAASACDSQSWRFIAVQDPALLAAMRDAVLECFERLAERPGLALQERKRLVARAQAMLFAKAPLCVAVVSVPVPSSMDEILRLACVSREEQERLCPRPDLQSAGAAVQLLTMSAEALGYGTFWTCAAVVAGDRLEELLDVEPPARLVALVAVGRPAGAPLPRKRLSVRTALSHR